MALHGPPDQCVHKFRATMHDRFCTGRAIGFFTNKNNFLAHKPRLIRKESEEKTINWSAF